MKSAPATVPTLFKLAAAAMLLAAVGGLGLAMWVDKGAVMFLSLAQAGLAWCF